MTSKELKIAAMRIVLRELTLHDVNYMIQRYAKEDEAFARCLREAPDKVVKSVINSQQSLQRVAINTISVLGEPSITRGKQNRR